jgi:hypothetical protein
VNVRNKSEGYEGYFDKNTLFMDIRLSMKYKCFSFAI